MTLSDADVARFRRSMRALLTPLEHEHPDEWRSAVNRAVGPLFGADMVTFQLPGADLELLYSEDIDVSLRHRYLPALAEEDTRFSRAAFEKTVTLQVCNREMLWGDELDEYYSSLYWNELVRPARGFDPLCSAVRLYEQAMPATLYLHHGSRRGPRFGQRGLALMRMLYPAFQAGVRAFHRFYARRHGFFRTLDAVDDALCVFDADGMLLHRNAGYERLALGEHEEEAASASAQRLARSLAALYTARRRRGESRDSRVTRRVWAGARVFQLEGSLVEGMGIGSRPILVVTVRDDGGPTGGTRVRDNGLPGLDDETLPAGGPAGGSRPQQSDIRGATERFALTPRQAEVAALVAGRLTNREVADRLGISVHTVRHHVERVLAKLDVASRRDVAAKLIDPGAASGF